LFERSLPFIFIIAEHSLPGRAVEPLHYPVRSRVGEPHALLQSEFRVTFPGQKRQGAGGITASPAPGDEIAELGRGRRRGCGIQPDMYSLHGILFSLQEQCHPQGKQMKLVANPDQFRSSDKSTHPNSRPRDCHFVAITTRVRQLERRFSHYRPQK